jgi:hypothetical protein
MKKLVTAVTMLVVALAAGPAAATDIRFSTGLIQDQFRNLSKEGGAALAYKNLAPAAPLGITGFDAGVQVSAVDIRKESAYWQAAFNRDAPEFLLIPSLRVRKGLPLGIDLGAMYSYVPDTNIKLFGFEASKALLEGSVATPALGVRATYTRLTGVSDLDLQTVGIDASISKGFVVVTPYAGAGLVWIDSEAKGALKAGTLPGGIALQEEKIWLPRGFAGLKVTPFPLFGVTAEVEYAARPIYSLKAAVSF